MSEKLTTTAADFATVAHILSGQLDELRLARESLAFCAEVYQRYTCGGATQEPANEHMDADKARNQLLDAIHRLLRI